MALTHDTPLLPAATTRKNNKEKNDALYTK